jgi:hypothetical protein
MFRGKARDETNGFSTAPRVGFSSGGDAGAKQLAWRRKQP